jgi:hypothetical protein
MSTRKDDLTFTGIVQYFLIIDGERLSLLDVSLKNGMKLVFSTPIVLAHCKIT